LKSTTFLLINCESWTRTGVTWNSSGMFHELCYDVSEFVKKKKKKNWESKTVYSV